MGRMLPVQVLALAKIPRLSPGLAQGLGISPALPSIGIVTTDCDDVTYIALDAATKAAQVEVAYAHSFYAGAANASTPLAGEVIGVLAGPDPDTVESGLQAALQVLHTLGFQAAENRQGVVYLAHTVSRTGAYLAQTAHIPVGQPLAYLVAPPAEAIVGLDAALKAAQVRLAEFVPPPSETNFAAGLLTGTESACQAACQAFADAIETLVR